jgi:phospholipase C
MHQAPGTLRRFSLFAVLAFIAVLSSGCGKGSATSSTPAADTSAKPALSLTLSPQSINAGEKAMLTWSASNATSVTVDGMSGTLALTGSQQVSPAATTTYHATATGPGGTTETTAMLTVTTPGVPPPTVSITASPATINQGGFTTLNWTSANATTLAIDPDVGLDADPFPLTGNSTVLPQQTTTYTATVTGPSGTASSSVTITVNPALPVVTLTATPDHILAGQSSALGWQSQNATALSIDNGVGTVSGANGTTSVSPAATTTYTITATGPGGSSTATATVAVPASNQLAATITVSPTSISPGQSATLTWGSQNATAVSISPGIGSVQPSGSMPVSPTGTTTYTITAGDGAGHQVTAQTTLVVLANGAFASNVKHIVVFVQENRGFLNYFGMLGKYRESKGLANEIDGITPDQVQPDDNNAPTHHFHFRTVCHENMTPDWNAAHFAAHEKNGVFQMDKFVQVVPTKTSSTGADKLGTRAMGYYDETDLPYYYELATQFATSDRFFNSLMSATIPNRFYLMAGTSFGHIHAGDPRPAHTMPDGSTEFYFDQDTLFDALNKAGIKWKYYYQDTAFISEFRIFHEDAFSRGLVRPIQEYYDILASPDADSKMAQVVFINQETTESKFTRPDGTTYFSSLDEHPGDNMQLGVARAKQIIDALMNSAAWQSSIFIQTYDESGGFADHVPPYSEPAPDDIAPIYKQGDPTGDFAHSGFRVPIMVISPWVRPHFVSHVQRDFSSIYRLIETRFGMSPLNPRDANADDMLEFFDFSKPALLTPPHLPDQPTNGVCDKTLSGEPGHPGNN